MILIIAKLALVAMAAIMVAVCAAYGATLLYVCGRFRRGTLLYVGKSLGITMVTVPLAVLLVLWGLLALGIHVNSRARAAWSRWRRQGELAQAPTKKSYHPNDVVVHLIHGTFESDASWTKEESPIRQEILALNPDVKFNRVIWSGLNTQRARTDAAKALAQVLLDSGSQNQYVVAHSHGGNIVKQLSHDNPALARQIRGVCLLSPPFIYRRRIERTARRFVLAHSLGFVLMALIPFVPLLHLLGPYSTPMAIAAAAVVVSLESRWAKKFQAELDEELRNEGDMHYGNVKILHAIGDEADSVLRFTSFLHETCFGLLSQLQATAREMKPSWWPLALALTGIGIAACWTWYASGGGQWIWLSGMALAMLALFVITLVKRKIKPDDEHDLLYMIASPVAVLSVWLGAAKSVAYGDWRLLFCPDIFVCTSETPSGAHAVTKYAPANDGALVHSTHSHEGAIRDTAAWLRASIAAQ